MIELALDTVVRFDGEGRLKNNSNAPDEDFARDDDVSDDETPTDAAFRLVREMRSARVGLMPSLRTWTAVLTACARAGDAKRADEAFERMQAMGVKPDRRAWTALIKAHAAGGDLRSAADAYWRMRDAGVTPDEATLSAALAAGPPRDGTTLDAAAAMSLYRDARALDVRPNNEGFRRLTGMWVDQAFDGERAEGKETAGVSEDTIVAASDHDAETTRSRLRSASASSAPDFMLASLVDDDSRDVGGYGARRSVSRKNDPWIDDGDARRPLVDVHGLSTVETRAAVLSVLQALRERRRARLAVSGDLVIVTGSPRARKSKH
jgi:pentatricopeptide repeat protein